MALITENLSTEEYANQYIYLIKQMGVKSTSVIFSINLQKSISEYFTSHHN